VNKLRQTDQFFLSYITQLGKLCYRESKRWSNLLQNASRRKKLNATINVLKSPTWLGFLTNLMKVLKFRMRKVIFKFCRNFLSGNKSYKT